HQHARPGGTDDADGRTTTIEGLAATALVEMSQENDRTACFAGQLVKGEHHLAYVLILAAIDAGEIRHERIDDDQLALMLDDFALDQGQVFGDFIRPLALLVGE